MPLDMLPADRPYTLIRTLDADSSQLLAIGSFRDLGAQFEAAAASAPAPHYIPVEVEAVRNWARYQSGTKEASRAKVFVLGPAIVETWILNVAAVLSLTAVDVG
jgi:hypothetical protein